MTKEKKGSAPTPTKGKGGGKGSGKDIDLKDCPLEFKQFSVENPKYVEKYQVVFIINFRSHQNTFPTFCIDPITYPNFFLQTTKCKKLFF